MRLLLSGIMLRQVSVKMTSDIPILDLKTDSKSISFNSSASGPLNVHSVAHFHVL